MPDTFAALLARVQDKTATIGIIGLGYVGLPLAMDFDHGIPPWFTEGASYASGIRHELGLYEAAFMIPIMALFVYWGRKDRPPGFFLAWFGLLYAPVRFVLDFLRNNDLQHQDLRWFGLTAAQYGMIAMAIAAAVFLRRVTRRA